ncbi:MAG: BsuBI/PstI family type II restriction endonuclease [Ktedonobacteraceae bacterium]
MAAEVAIPNKAKLHEEKRKLVLFDSSFSDAVAVPSNDSPLSERVDFLRLDASRKLTESHKAAMGQFFTPMPIARFMASMLVCDTPIVHILDAGAGVGSLFAASVSELCHRQVKPKQIQVTAYEIDRSLAEYLNETLLLCKADCQRAGIQFSGEILQTDFIESAVDQLRGGLFSTATETTFTCAILNPPYRKINTDSKTRMLLRQIGIETSNLYTAFLAASVQLLEPLGELVAITPRSFCNGPYFTSFRKSFLKTMNISRLHIFESREQAFQDDEVLQENVILHATKEVKKSELITISSSIGPDDEFMTSRNVSYSQVVHPEDPHAFIHIVPDDRGQWVAERMARFHSTLEDLNLEVSTGRVVDFRATSYIRQQPEPGTVPLIYPTHFEYGYVAWPKPEAKKPNAIVNTEQTQVLLVPNENYVLVKRFSSKEEKKRIVAAIYESERISGPSVGFENHLNYFHRNGEGLDITLARGLAAFLNSTLVDEYFRQFNGHTQVNATDLRSMKYPTLHQLEALGSMILSEFPQQNELDERIEEEFSGVSDSQGGGDPVQAKRRIEEALKILKDLGLPRAQQNERSALTLLALLDLKPETQWWEASRPLCGITPMMDFMASHYGKSYKPNTRETVRRQTVHQFLDAGFIVANPDEPERPINSPKAVYQIERSALELLRTYDTPEWDHNIRAYLSSIETLKTRYAQEREMKRIPVKVAPGNTITLSPGGQNILVKQIIDEFAPRYTPGGTVLYVGDTDNKFAYFDERGLTELGVKIETHGKMPDVIIHYTERNWLVLIEAVTSHGPIDPKRKNELQHLFRNSKAGIVYITTFLTRRAMVEYLNEISWETEVWVAEAPSHLIHFNGERFLGPY